MHGLHIRSENMSCLLMAPSVCREVSGAVACGGMHLSALDYYYCIYRIAGNIGGKNIWQFWTDLNIGGLNFGDVTMDYVTVQMMQ